MSEEGSGRYYMKFGTALAIIVFAFGLMFGGSISFSIHNHTNSNEIEHYNSVKIYVLPKDASGVYLFQQNTKINYSSLKLNKVILPDTVKLKELSNGYYELSMIVNPALLGAHIYVAIGLPQNTLVEYYNLRAYTESLVLLFTIKPDVTLKLKFQNSTNSIILPVTVYVNSDYVGSGSIIYNVTTKNTVLKF